MLCDNKSIAHAERKRLKEMLEDLTKVPKDVVFVLGTYIQA